jgi:hypothetical protein
MWEQWEYTLQEDLHKQSMLTEKNELKSMLDKEQQKQASPESNDPKKKNADTTNANLEQLSNKLDSVLTLT